jgi:hypothetical protein
VSGRPAGAGPGDDPGEAVGGSWGALVAAVGVRPWLWLTGLAVVFRMARPGWWRRWPPVPRPDPSYWRFRMETAYGGEGDRHPPIADALAYLRWCRRTRAVRG